VNTNDTNLVSVSALAIYHETIDAPFLLTLKCRFEGNFQIRSIPDLARPLPRVKKMPLRYAEIHDEQSLRRVTKRTEARRQLIQNAVQTNKMVAFTIEIAG
jgi:hypothetical protein